MEQLLPERVEDAEASKKIKTPLERALEVSPDEAAALDPDSLEGGKGSLKTAAERAMEKTDPIAENYNASKPEKSDIDDVSTFEELDTIIDQSKGLQGSQEFFDPATLKEIIGRVRKGDLGLEYVTRSQGLREKVAQLLEDEKVDTSEAVDHNGSTDPVVHEYADNKFDTIVASQPKNYTLGQEPASEKTIDIETEVVEKAEKSESVEKTNDAEAAETVEDPLDFEAIGKARLERVLARASEVQDRVQGYGKSLWEKAKDYTAKGAKAIGTGVRKAFYMTFAVPEMLEASDAYLGEKYAQLIDAGNAKYKEIADKIASAKETFLNHIKAAQEKRQERRDKIAKAKADIVDAKARLKAAKNDWKTMLTFY